MAIRTRWIICCRWSIANCIGWRAAVSGPGEPGHTLQTTALFHEAYLRLVGQEEVQWQNRAHFFAIAAPMMRRILVDYARSRRYAKRGGGAQKIPFDEMLSVSGGGANVVAVDEALTTLAKINPRKSKARWWSFGA